MVVQRHLATKHQLQKEETKDFDINFVEPKREPISVDANETASNSSYTMLRNVYSPSPPWLAGQNDYNGNPFLNGSYNSGNQYVNYITDVEENKPDNHAQAMCPGRTENKDLNQNSLMGGNNAKPIILCPDMDEEKIREIKGPRPIMECPEIKWRKIVCLQLQITMETCNKMIGFMLKLFLEKIVFVLFSNVVIIFVKSKFQYLK